MFLHVRQLISLTGLSRVGEHVAEFDTLFLADLEDGQLSEKYLCESIEGQQNALTVMYIST